MNLRRFYKKLIREVLGLPCGFSFGINFPTRGCDASSNVLILVSNDRKVSAEDVYLKVASCLKSSVFFEGINFNQNNGTINWYIPKKVWVHQLLVVSNFLKNSKHKVCLSFMMDSDKLFQIQYVYARIHSVIRHFYEKFPHALEYTNANLDLISRKDIINLIKVIANYPSWFVRTLKSGDPDFLCKYLLRLSDSFNQIWDFCDEKGAELCFVLPDNPDETNARVFVLDVFQKLLEKSSEIIGFTLEKEFK